MNEETLGLIANVIEELIAAIPQIVLVLTTVLYSLNAIKAKVNMFPKIADDTKLVVSNDLKDSKDKVQKLLENSSIQINELLKLTNKDIQEKVGSTLKTMEKELTDYKQHLVSNVEQTNLLVRQNKVFMDVLIQLVSENPESVSKGIAGIVSTKLQLSKQELEQYPAVLVKDLKVFEKALKEVYLVAGEKSLKELLDKIGYGKEN
jgi:hypothetical protein